MFLRQLLKQQNRHGMKSPFYTVWVRLYVNSSLFPFFFYLLLLFYALFLFFFFCDFSACCCCFLTRSVWAVDDCWPFPTELKRGGHTHNSVFLFFFFFLTYALCLTSVCFIDSRSLWHIYTIFLFFSFGFFFFAYDLRWHPLSLSIYILFLFRTQYCTLSKKRNKKRILKQPSSSESTSFCLTVGRGWWK